MADPSFHLALVLAGGNALGSYQAGVYEALHGHGLEPGWIVGTSVGAINGAVIAGNAPGARIGALRDLWRPAAVDAGWPSAAETWRRTLSVQHAALAGRPGWFDPVGPLGSWWRPDADAAAPALFDQAPLAGTLARLVDWQRLNDGAIRYAALAVDMADGSDRLFDTHRERVSALHVRASGALPPVFPPVSVDGRMLADGGLSANLPLDPVLGEADAPPTLCIAVDLLPLAAPLPTTLGETMARAQDLSFAIQSRRTIARWQHAYRVGAPPGGGVALACLAYADQRPEVAGKALDFSPESVAHRWRAGITDGHALAERIAAGIAITPGALTML
ncbi:patatin-like phospholipase family protein [Sphingomonas sp. CLY1604]|uniref:patatin-like phospholipase family protein n=1 Tax=Sphingomonas sp. CLY1604 TaxID=3457786 RepID=UPI003FD775BB